MPSLGSIADSFEFDVGKRFIVVGNETVDLQKYRDTGLAVPDWVVDAVFRDLEVSDPFEDLRIVDRLGYIRPDRIY